MKENTIVIERNKRYSKLPDETKNKLKEFDNLKASEYQLLQIKKTRPKLKTGDVFVLSPRENVYFYGKVLKTNINHISNDDFIGGKNVVFIFKNKTKEININDFKPDYSNLLIRPAIVDISYWTSGLFYNVGNIELTEKEKNLDYGFLGLHVNDYYYCSEEGVILKKKPNILGMYGITTIIGIAAKIERELIINPNILTF